jgi:hypothetical protein
MSGQEDAKVSASGGVQRLLAQLLSSPNRRPPHNCFDTLIQTLHIKQHRPPGRRPSTSRPYGIGHSCL